MVETICICGAGTMGTGIAVVSAQSGFYTILYDLNPSVLAKAKIGFADQLQKRVEKGPLTQEQVVKMIQRTLFTNDLQLCMADLIIEAVVEKLEVKIALFNQLAEINHSETVFASNTSSLSLTSIAESVKCPERVIGMHFFNPAPVMKLVEIVCSPFTNQGSADTVAGLARQMGKTAVLCKDSPGFIVNRVARPYYLEALHLFEEGHADVQAIDLLLESSGFRMGPFRLMDLIGNDINLAVSQSVFDQLGKPPRLKPSGVQEKKVGAGELGIKTGRGYYIYK